MKKTALVILLVLVFALCSCESKDFNGTYETSSLFGLTLVLSGEGEEQEFTLKGEDDIETFVSGRYTKLLGKDSFDLNSTTPMSILPTEYSVVDGIVYGTNGFSRFDSSVEFDQDGKTEGEIQGGIIDGETGNRYHFGVSFNNDGSCKIIFIIFADYGYGKTIADNSYEGTYSVDGDIVTINYEGDEHKIVCVNGEMYFFTFE